MFLVAQQLYIPLCVQLLYGPVLVDTELDRVLGLALPGIEVVVLILIRLGCAAWRRRCGAAGGWWTGWRLGWGRRWESLRGRWRAESSHSTLRRDWDAASSIGGELCNRDPISGVFVVARTGSWSGWPAGRRRYRSSWTWPGRTGRRGRGSTAIWRRDTQVGHTNIENFRWIKLLRKDRGARTDQQEDGWTKEESGVQK